MKEKTQQEQAEEAEHLPDTAAGPLYRAWAALRDAQIVRELELGRRDAEAMRKLKAHYTERPLCANPRNGRVSQIRQRVLARMNGHPMTVDEMGVTMFRRSSVQVELGRMVRDGLVLREGRGLYLKNQ